MISVPCDDGRDFRFEPECCALISIDFQRDFIDAEGGCNLNQEGSARLAAIVPVAQSVLAAAREAGLTVLHTRESYAPDLSDVNGLKREKDYVGRDGPLGRCLIRGEPGCDLVPDMKALPGERVVDKPGFSAFCRTDLDKVLQDAGITHLIMMGVTYQCCVHSTLRDAVDRGYYCLTIDDACAAPTPELEEAVRQIIRSEGNLFGWISHSAPFCAALGASGRSVTTATVTDEA